MGYPPAHYCHRLSILLLFSAVSNKIFLDHAGVIRALSMAQCIIFFSRCRPQWSDPIDLVVRERRVFIGWPAWRKGVEPRRGYLREAVVDLWCPDDEWGALYSSFGPERRHYQQNRNFIRTVQPGAIALVPRPNRGIVYAGRVIRPFELLNDPPWGDQYLQLRRDQGLDAGNEVEYLADVAQCCEVDHFRAVPFPAIPAWIRRSLLGRSTYGQVKPMPGYGLDPYSALHHLIDHPEQAERGWTRDAAEVGRRLTDFVRPSTFEHLCIALLQLEHPEQIWVHVGGSGDGGVDGIGSDASGAAVGLLQCRWVYWGEQVFVEISAARGATRRILAAFLHPEGVQLEDSVEFWPRDRITALVIKHADRLPLALSLRVGRRGSS